MNILRPARYEPRQTGGVWIVFDTFRQESIDPLDIDRPVMPLAQIRYMTKEVAVRACARLNRAYSSTRS